MEVVGVLCNSCFDWGQVSGAQIRIQHLWFKVKSIAMLRSTLELSKGEKKETTRFPLEFPMFVSQICWPFPRRRVFIKHSSDADLQIVSTDCVPVAGGWLWGALGQETVTTFSFSICCRY